MKMKARKTKSVNERVNRRRKRVTEPTGHSSNAGGQISVGARGARLFEAVTPVSSFGFLDCRFSRA